MFARNLPARFDSQELHQEEQLTREQKIEKTARNIVIAYDNLHQWPQDQAEAALRYSVSVMRTLVKTP